MRDLDWEGCFNARDLGGLATRDGRRTRFGSIVRSDGLDELTSRGWQALESYGIRTIIDLRNDDERADTKARPGGITTVHLPLDNVEVAEFWSEWNSGWQFGTPLYYGPHITRFPERSARVIRAIARAEPGGVLFHCVGGRDRTGMIAMLVLWLIDAELTEIVTDYELSTARLSPLFARRGEPDAGPLIAGFLQEIDASFHEIIAETLTHLDVDGWMKNGGLTDADRIALRARLVE